MQLDLVTCISTEEATTIDSVSIKEASKAVTAAIRIVEAYHFVLINFSLVESAKIN
jgi:hypothetical protein